MKPNCEDSVFFLFSDNRKPHGTMSIPCGKVVERVAMQKELATVMLEIIVFSVP